MGNIGDNGDGIGKSGEVFGFEIAANIDFCGSASNAGMRSTDVGVLLGERRFEGGVLESEGLCFLSERSFRLDGLLKEDGLKRIESSYSSNIQH